MKVQYPDHFRRVKTLGSSLCQWLPNRQRYINTFYRREITCYRFKLEQRSLHQLDTKIFNLCLSDSKFVLKSVDSLRIINAFACFISIDLYCDLNKKVKGYKLLFFLQQQKIVPKAFFKLVSIVSVPMFTVSNGSYGSIDSPFHNIKAKHLPNQSK